MAFINEKEEEKDIKMCSSNHGGSSGTACASITLPHFLFLFF